MRRILKIWRYLISWFVLFFIQIGAQDNPKLTPIINALASVTQDGKTPNVNPLLVEFLCYKDE